MCIFIPWDASKVCNLFYNIEVATIECFCTEDVACFENQVMADDVINAHQPSIFRQMLAALHYNENSQRIQATKKDGSDRYSIKFPKNQKSNPVVREVKVDITYGKHWILTSVDCYFMFQDLMKISLICTAN